MLTVVAGISSSGKSTYIKSIDSRKLLLASQVKRISEIPNDAFLHYNTLRYAEINCKYIDRDFFCDQLLCSLIGSIDTFSCHFIFCGKDELLSRVRQRLTVEDGLGQYPQKEVEQFVLTIDYLDFQKRWVSTLSQYASEMQLIHSSNDTFQIVTHDDLIRLVQN